MLIYICLDRSDGLRPDNLEAIDTEIRSLGARSEHPMTSLWLLDSALSVDAIAERLSPYVINSANRLLVGQIGGRTNGILPRDLWPWINGQANP